MPSANSFEDSHQVLKRVPHNSRTNSLNGLRLSPLTLDQLYEPIHESLERVKGTLESLARQESPFVAEMLDHILESQGKCVRPAITLLSAGFHPNGWRRAENMACAVELLHIATLIHDDTVDNADIRRGRATVGKLWGTNAAVLIGDYVFATSATFVCDTGNIRVVRRFSETLMELSTGELHEMAGAYDWNQTREEYLERIYNKTASLFTTACESGAVLSGAPEPTIQALKQYGYNLGMAFQIVDDILDFDGAAEEVGKPVGIDLAQGILTLPALLAMERHPLDNPILELSRGSDHEEYLKRAVELVREPPIIEESYAVAEQYSQNALACLSALEPSPFRESLRHMVYHVVTRRS